MASSTAASSTQQLYRRVAFAATGAVGFGTSAYMFHTLTDFSQSITNRTSRNEFMDAYQHRHERAAIGMAGIIGNTLVYWSNPIAIGIPKLAWAGLNLASIGLWYGGYLNPEIMLRPRNHNSVYVSTCDAAKICKDDDTCVVTQINGQEPCAYPDKQILRPHMALVGNEPTTGNPVTICYCGLTGTGVVYEVPPNEDGTPKELVPITQMKNNLIILDKSTGHFGHQINGINETKLLEALGESNYDKVGTRPTQDELKRLGLTIAKEVPAWRMTVGNFREAYPHGKVFINDYREFPSSITQRPVLTLYDKIIDTVFDRAIHKHNTQKDFMLFPTIQNVDQRLDTKQRVYGFNVNDEFACVTEDFAKNSPKGIVNFTLGNKPLVASWDYKHETIGIFVRPNDKPIIGNVNVYGIVEGNTNGKEKLKRLSTVKAGLFWFVWQEFFPNTLVNEELLLQQTK